MKAIRIRAARSVHPEYFKTRGKKYIEHAAGEIVEHPEVAKLCLGVDPFFAPHDEECRKAVSALLAAPRRVHELARLRSMFANRSQLSDGAQKYVSAVFNTHKAEIEGVTPAQQAASVVEAD